MVVLLVILTIAAFCIGEYVYRARIEARERETSLVPEAARYEVPAGLFVHRGHTWAHLGLEGGARVGMDAFAQSIVGRIDRVDLPAWGKQVEQGKRLFSIVQGHKRVDFVSPLDGMVTDVNAGINENPSATLADPYRGGWIVEIKPSRFVQNLKELKSAQEARSWIAREARIFREFLSLHLLVPQEAGATMQDGGAPADGILEKMDGEVLALFARKFLR